MKIFLILFFLFTINLSSNQDINILVGKNPKKIEIISKNFTVYDENVGDKIFSFDESKKIIIENATINEKEPTLKIFDKKYPTTGIIIESEDYYSVFGKKLKFRLAVVLFKNELYVINILPLESYLEGIINSEISSKWPMETIKAQVVASRTYALRKKIYNYTLPYDLNTTVLDQVYKGISIIDQTSVDAVKETYGEVITYNNELIEAFFHSNSGGFTESSEIFNNIKLPYIESKEDEFSIGQPSSNWSFEINIKDLTSTLKKEKLITGKLKKITIKERSKSGRVLKAEIISDKTIVINGDYFRRIIGSSKFLSSKFGIELKNKNILLIEGIGYGHGVGMSQWGAFQMGKSGKNYKEILSFYYEKIKIKKIY